MEQLAHAIMTEYMARDFCPHNFRESLRLLSLRQMVQAIWVVHIFRVVPFLLPYTRVIVRALCGDRVALARIWGRVRMTMAAPPGWKRLASYLRVIGRAMCGDSVEQVRIRNRFRSIRARSVSYFPVIGRAMRGDLVERDRIRRRVRIIIATLTGRPRSEEVQQIALSIIDSDVGEVPKRATDLEPNSRRPRSCSTRIAESNHDRQIYPL
ncbi:MAG: hypothetical protein ACT4OO_05540 [Nitrospiraceae bacterium]